MSMENPYAPPQTATPALNPVVSAGGLWRDGKILVMHRQAKLPDRCVKSNQPASRRLRRKLTWHHPAVFLALLANLLIYAILATVLSKRATIEIPLSERWFAKRRRRMLIAWTLVLACVVMFIVGLANIDQNEQLGGPLAALGFFGLLAAAIYGLLSCRLIYPNKITDDYIWLKGVHPDFLATLPDLPQA